MRCNQSFRAQYFSHNLGLGNMHEISCSSINNMTALSQAKAFFIGPSCTDNHLASVISQVVSEIERHTCVRFQDVQTRIPAENVAEVKICYLPVCSGLLVNY